MHGEPIGSLMHAVICFLTRALPPNVKGELRTECFTTRRRKSHHESKLFLPESLSLVTRHGFAEYSPVFCG